MCVCAEYRKREYKKGQRIVHIIFVCSLLVRRCFENMAFVVCIACVCVLLVFAGRLQIVQSIVSPVSQRNVLKLFFHLPLCCYHRQCSFFAQIFVFTPAFCGCFYCIIILPLRKMVIQQLVTAGFGQYSLFAEQCQKYSENFVLTVILSCSMGVWYKCHCHAHSFITSRKNCINNLFLTANLV